MFVQAIEKVKKDYEELLQDSPITSVLKKETLDETVMRVIFVKDDAGTK